MAKAKRDPFVAVDTVGDIRVYPMKINQSELVSKYFNNINLDWIMSNFVVPKTDELGIPMTDENGDIVPYDKPKNSIIEILKLATKLSDEQIGELDIPTVTKIIEEYMDISSLKKKMMPQ
jgi:hypothetical protein